MGDAAQAATPRKGSEDAAASPVLLVDMRAMSGNIALAAC